MKKYLYTLLSLFITVSTFAQNGFEITINTTNCSGKRLDLRLYQGTAQLNGRFDSSKITLNKQSVSMKNVNRNPGLICQLKFNDKPDFLNIVVDKGAKITFSVENGDIYSLKAINSPINSQFLDYQHKVLTAEQKVTLQNTLSTKYPNSIINLYFKLQAKINAKRPNTYEEAYAEIKTYWNGLNKNDASLRYLPNTFQYYFRFITLLPITNEFYQQGVDSLMHGLTEKDKNYVFNLSWVFKNLAYFKSENLEKSYVAIYNKYLKNQNVKFDNPSEYSIIATKASIAEKLENGTHTPEFEMVDTLNVTHKLSEILPEKPFTFLIFYDPDCHHCQDAILKLNAFFRDNPKYLDKIKRVAILNVRNDAKWLDFIRQKQLNAWMNLKSIDPKRQYEKDFETIFNPAFFLLDSKGIIVNKSGEVEDIKRLVGPIN